MKYCTCITRESIKYTLNLIHLYGFVQFTINTFIQHLQHCDVPNVMLETNDLAKSLCHYGNLT